MAPPLLMGVFEPYAAVRLVERLRFRGEHRGPWVAPSPVRADELENRKVQRRRKARMDARTREGLPVLPMRVRTVDQRRQDAAALLEAARHAAPGEVFTAAGQQLERAVVPHGTAAAGSGPRTRPPESAAIWDSKRRGPSGPGPWSRSCGPPASASRNCWNSATAWSNTGCPPPVNSSPCCRSSRPRRIPRGCCWSALSSPTS